MRFTNAICVAILALSVSATADPRCRFRGQPCGRSAEPEPVAVAEPVAEPVPEARCRFRGQACGRKREASPEAWAEAEALAEAVAAANAEGMYIIYEA